MSSTAQNESHLFPTYARTEFGFVRGEGVWLEGTDGRRYLDCMGGIAVNALGHAHPRLVAALKDQAEKLWHVSNLFQIPGQEELGTRLTDATFADRVFFTNSGAEALECAIKTARRYHFVNDAPERVQFVTFEGAFHGRTLATIAAGGQEKYLEGFGPKVAGFDQVPFADVDAVKAAITEETAALLIEPIQGEGGIRTVPNETLRALRELCDEKNILMVLDEVQSGMGRTGKLFAHEWAGIEPDIMAVAKAIGGGFPLGACLATEAASSGMTAGTHGTTFGGNPLAMAVGNAVMEIIADEAFLQGVRDRGLRLKQKLAAVADSYPDLIEEIRGEGLMLGVRCKTPNVDVVAAASQEGLLIVPAGDNVARFLPPLNISDEEIDEAVGRLDRAFARLAADTAAA